MRKTDFMLVSNKMNITEAVQKMTITGACGAGKGTVGKIIAQKLGFRFVSLGDIFRNVARERGCRDIAELHDMARTDPGIDLAIDAYTKLYGIENDRFVFDARLGWYWIPQAFKVFLSCEDDERFRRIANRENKSFESSRAETLFREKEMKEQYMVLYKIDDFMSMDESRFDFIIDTTFVPPDKTADAVIQAFGRRVA